MENSIYAIILFILIFIVLLAIGVLIYNQERDIKEAERAEKEKLNPFDDYIPIEDFQEAVYERDSLSIDELRFRSDIINYIRYYKMIPEECAILDPYWLEQTDYTYIKLSEQEYDIDTFLGKYRSRIKNQIEISWEYGYLDIEHARFLGMHPNKQEHSKKTNLYGHDINGFYIIYLKKYGYNSTGYQTGIYCPDARIIILNPELKFEGTYEQMR